MIKLSPDYTYKIKNVSRIIDGDTVDLEIDLGFYTFVKKRVRLYGINTPEVRTRNAAEKVRGFAAKARLEELLSSGNLILVSNGIGKYGRVLGTIYGSGGECNGNINYMLIAEGHAEKYEE